VTTDSGTCPSESTVLSTPQLTQLADQGIAGGETGEGTDFIVPLR